MPPRRTETARVRVLHPLQWLWEPLEPDPTFVLRAMFGTKAVYLDGKMMLCFSHGDEPWHGLLLCTAHEHHAALRADFPELAPHSILPKWLYLRAAGTAFDRVAPRLVELARRRDPRVGVLPKPKKSKRRRAASRPS